jgi:ribosomal protein S18 acetylase RimI-like enzyme
MKQSGYRCINGFPTIQLSIGLSRELNQLIYRCFKESMECDHDDDASACENRLASGYVFWIVDQGGRAVAVLNLESDKDNHVYIWNLCVATEHRGNRLSTMLLQNVQKWWLDNHNAEPSPLFLNVAQSNQVAIQIYKRNGFQLIKPFITPEGTPALLMRWK